MATVTAESMPLETRMTALRGEMSDMRWRPLADTAGHRPEKARAAAQAAAHGKARSERRASSARRPDPQRNETSKRFLHSQRHWIPAFAGMTNEKRKSCVSHPSLLTPLHSLLA